ncbi:unnamed protein product [Ilex paraguariensis]|uniref:K Homology domain-containing protein n=1 Tax=Ilex paraguariensis TaxID=185542 RepID=A0ABC8S4T6_9AQUA
MVSAKEEPDVTIPPAMDGLLRVHKRIIDAETDPNHAAAGGIVCTRLLVAATQAGSLIGKQGATIKSIQDTSHCTIRVLGEENLPVFAIPDDSVVEIQGVSTGVHKAVELIATHLRKFLVDRSVIGIFEMQPVVKPSGLEMISQWCRHEKAHYDQNVISSSLIRCKCRMLEQIRTCPHPNPGALLLKWTWFVPNPPYMQPPRQFDNYYAPADMPPLDKQPRQGPPAFGRDASMGAHTTSMQPQQSMVTKVSQNMQIPLSYADAVIGTSGSNISYIRRASGATIAIQETRGVPGEMTVEINGSASQNFIADAASAAQNPAGGPPGQGYNSYPSHVPVYASPPSNATGHTGHAPAGDYGSVYGANYGY